MVFRYISSGICVLVITHLWHKFNVFNPLQYNLFAPHGDYFNLHKDRVKYNANNAECRILTEDGNTVGDMNVGSESGSGCADNSVDGDDKCPDCDVNYICRIG